MAMLTVVRYCNGHCWTRSLSSSSLSWARHKKDVRGPFPPVYNATEVEKDWYEWWKNQERGYFRRREACVDNERFTMVLPPPNVTGKLHVGHALTCAIQDALVRWHRMRGYDTAWIPGSDHAGIATQECGYKCRKAFVDTVWKWREEKGGEIFQQLERLGASLDWNYTKFTLSADHSKAVRHAFITLFDRGLIYRGNFLVNWSCSLKSTISDMEVEHTALAKPAKVKVPGYDKPIPMGYIYDMAYELEGSPERIRFSTTRPETVLGDVAVAVHPEDSRYTHLIGKNVLHPFRTDNEGQPVKIPVIADAHVDPEFGTGAVKITPAHDKNDLEIGKRHKLPIVTVIDDNGNMDVPGIDQFHKIPRFQARKSVIDAMSDLGLFHGRREHAMSIPICSRSSDVIEPLLKPQWFVKIRELGEKAIQAAESGQLQFIPEYYERVWKHWLSDDVDWCISRQLWWGHQIPAFRFYDDKGNETWIAAESSAAALEKAVIKLGGIDHQCILAEQDPDVLDTWFSSALIPFSYFGWPDNKRGLNGHYPLSLMETGHDILFFWVARMVMLGQELTGELPFNKVLLHGLVRDGEGRKMSKSLGNVIDPMHVIEGRSLEELKSEVVSSGAAGVISAKEQEVALKGIQGSYPQGIAAFGADVLRFELCRLDIKGVNLNMNLTRLKTTSAFGNKLWQCARFISQYHERSSSDNITHVHPEKMTDMPLMDAWLLSRCASTVSLINDNLENANFHLAAAELRTFLYHNLCDVYLEAVKTASFDNEHEHFEAHLRTLQVAFTTGLKLLHPLMPFLTEELFQRLPKLSGESRADSIMIEKYPEVDLWRPHLCPNLEKRMDQALKIITEIRTLKMRFELGGKVKPPVRIEYLDENQIQGIQFDPIICTLAKCGPIDHIFVSSFTQDSVSVAGTFLSTDNSEIRISLDMEGIIDIEKELVKNAARINKVEKNIQKLDSIRKKPGYAERSEEARLSDQEKYEGFLTNIARLREQRNALEKLK